MGNIPESNASGDTGMYSTLSYNTNEYMKVHIFELWRKI